VDARYKSENLAVVQAMNAGLDAQWASRGTVEAKSSAESPDAGGGPWGSSE
jgi:hypothetical protein